MPRLSPFHKLLCFALSWLIMASGVCATNNIKLGMSIALSGPAQGIGKQLRDGAQLYFDELNKQGGVAGQLIELTVLDDGYEPNRTVINTKQLVDVHQVNALFSYMGTPTTSAIKPLLEYSQIPLLMPFTGADFLHGAPTFQVFNLRASYKDEAMEQVRFLVNEKQHQHIALLIQADEFGITLEKSITQSLLLSKLKPVIVTRFRRNTTDVDKALEQIQATNATAVIMVGTYEPLAKFIELAKQAKSTLDFTTVSFVSSKALFQRIKVGENVMVTEVMPDPNLCSTALCDKFRAQVEQHPELVIDHVLFEGYLNALVFSRAAMLCKNGYSNQCIMRSLPAVLMQDNELKSLFELPQQQKKLPVYRSYSS